MIKTKNPLRHKKIKEDVIGILKEIVRYKKRINMPFKDIATVIEILFPETKNINRRLIKEKSNKGHYKRVFIIYSGEKKEKNLVLKIGRKNRHIQKDHTTYTQLCKRLGQKKANTYFAKIYWRDGLFMLQKYGKKVKNVPDKEIQRLKKKTGLIDLKSDNIMKFGNKFKIVDAERRKK